MRLKSHLISRRLKPHRYRNRPHSLRLFLFFFRKRKTIPHSFLDLRSFSEGGSDGGWVLKYSACRSGDIFLCSLRMTEVKGKFQLPIKQSFPAMEDATLKFWEENKIFEKSVEGRSEDNRFVFVDGPPFVSGNPHYAHLLVSIAKDLVPRYWTMKGKRVRRVWGWDCHGLPVENEIENWYFAGLTARFPYFKVNEPRVTRLLAERPEQIIEPKDKLASILDFDSRNDAIKLAQVVGEYFDIERAIQRSPSFKAFYKSLAQLI